MLKNFLILSFRNLWRNKVYTLINILGLATGLAACLLIYAIVKYELSYDGFQPNYKRIYHIFTRDDYADGITYTPGIPYPALNALRNDLPEAKLAPLYSSYGCQVVVTDAAGLPVQGKKFIEDFGFFFSEPQFFEVFNYNWLAGNAALLAQPGQAVLTESVAVRYFGSWQGALGQTIKVDNHYLLKVAGILKNPPNNSDFPLRILASYKTFQTSNNRDYSEEWHSITSNFQIYGLFPPGVSEQQLTTSLKTLSDKYYGNKGRHKRINAARPLSEIHFDERMGNFGFGVTPKSTLTTLSLIAFLVVLMACINFINLSTAMAVTRSKEVGVRKVLGGTRLQLFRQFMSETALLALLSGLSALAIAAICAPHLKNIINIPENLSMFTTNNLAFLVSVVALCSILAGVYPSLVLSSFRPVLALKNKISSRTLGGISLRRVLVVLQFTISQVLIAGTVVAMWQMHFIRTADLGFNKNELLILEMNSNDELYKHREAFSHALKQIPGVKQISLCSDVPSSQSNWGSNFAFDLKPDENFTLFMKLADDNYQNTFGLQMAAGRWYNSRNDTARQVVINETLARRLGLKQPADAVGKLFRIGGGKWETICGVVKDFKTNTLREEIKPMAIQTSGSDYFAVALKLSGGNLGAVRQKVEECWNTFFPDYVVSSKFYDENIERFYEREKQMTLAYKIFAALAIFISCLGLYGLVSFMALQRTKEVGIRKVLGAGIKNILFLFSREFTWLIVFAFAIATPLAWYFMNHWLQSFVFRIELEAWVFALAFMSSLLLAWLAVGYKSLKAARANPVNSLRNE